MYKRRSPADIKFIAVDWGASNFRAYAIDSDGNVRQRTKAHQGVARIKDGSFASALKRLLGKWFNKYPNVPVIMVGVIGGETGWQEVENVEAPVALEDLAVRLEKVVNHRFDRDIYIVPGVKVLRDNRVSFDHMRGEEVQAFGALKQLDSAEHHYICCPGAHSKWIQVDDNSICNVHSFMTGELFALLSRFSLVGTGMEGTFVDHDVFQRGLAVSKESDHLLADLYTVYTEGKAECIRSTSLSCYMSALLVGNEMKSVRKMFPDMKKFVLVGAPWVMELYQMAAQFYGLEVEMIKSDHAVVAGLVDVYQRMIGHGQKKVVNFNR